MTEVSIVEIFQEFWPTIISICGLIAAITKFYIDWLKIKELRIKIKTSKEKKSSSIVAPTEEELKIFSRRFENSRRFVSLFLVFGISVTVLNLSGISLDLGSDGSDTKGISSPPPKPVNSSGSEEGNGSGVDKGNGDDDETTSLFKLSWEGDIERDPLVKPIPSNTVGMDAVITVRFEVIPDGTVGRIIPIRRMNSGLEFEVMKTLRTWRFSRLPDEVPQQAQWGTIRFAFSVD